MSLLGATEIIANRLLLVEGMKSAFTAPPEQMSPGDFPAILTYPGSGMARFITADNGNGRVEVAIPSTIVADMHMDRKGVGLAESTYKSNIYLPLALVTIFRAYLDDHFEGNVSALGNINSQAGYPITFSFLNMGWGSVETMGYRIRIDVTVEEEI